MHFKAPVTEQLLIQECKRGSLKYQEMLYKHFYGFAMGVCLRYSLNNDDAAEAVNDTFIKVFNAIQQYNETHPFKAWLRTILVNTAIDRRRKEMKHQLQLEISEALPIADHASIVSRLYAKDILKLLNLLPPLHRTIFNLYEIDGYSHDEIGDMLGLPTSTSRVYLSRAKDKLKKVLNSESEQYG